MWWCLIFHEGQFFVIVVLGSSGQHKFATRIHSPLRGVFSLKWTTQEHTRDTVFDFAIFMKVIIITDTHLHWTYSSSGSSVSIGLTVRDTTSVTGKGSLFSKTSRPCLGPTQPSNAQPGKHLSDARTQNTHNHDTYISLYIIQSYCYMFRP